MSLYFVLATVGKLSADAGSLLVKYSRPPDLKPSSNVSLPFAQSYEIYYITLHLLALQGPQQTPAYLTLYFGIIDDRMSHSQKQNKKIFT